MIAFALIAVAAALPQPQSVQQPNQIVPAPANFNQEQGRAGAAPEGAAKDLQGSASIGYGYYGGYPGYGGYYGGYGGFYGGYPGYGYGGMRIDEAGV